MRTYKITIDNSIQMITELTDAEAAALRKDDGIVLEEM